VLQPTKSLPSSHIVRFGKESLEHSMFHVCHERFWM
jgi:hypothetical protein